MNGALFPIFVCHFLLHIQYVLSFLYTYVYIHDLHEVRVHEAFERKVFLSSSCNCRAHARWHQHKSNAFTMNEQTNAKKGRIWQTHSQRSQVPFGIFADTNNVFAMSSYLWNWKEYEHDRTRHFHFHLRTLFFAPVQLMLVCAWVFFVFLNESQCNMLRQSSSKNKRRHNFGVCKNGWNVSFCGNNRYNFRFLNK